MTNNSININHQTAGDTIKDRPKTRFRLPFYEIAEYILTFFMNKIILFGTISPFGIAYFASTFPMQEMSFGTIAAFLGIIFTGFGVSSLKYLGALALYLLFMMLYNKDISNKKWISALVASLSLYAMGMVFVLSDGFLLYDTLLLTLEAIVSFLSFFVFEKASLLIRTINSRKTLETSEILSVIFLFSTLLLSISSTPNLEGVAQVLAIFIILSVALCGDAALACVSGLILGAVLSINSPLPSQIICTYAVSGLFAGLFREKGKIFVSIAFIFANALVTLYFNASSLTLINISCTLSATLIVLLMPKSAFRNFSNFAQQTITPPKNSSGDRAALIIGEKLGEYSNSFKELTNIFSYMTEQSTQTNDLSAGAIFDSAFSDVCKDCTLCTYCWHKNYTETISMLNDMFSSMSTRGYAEEFDAPCDFRSSCIHFDDFLEAVNKYYEIHKINLSWASRVCESKMLLTDQFKNISSALDNMKNKFSNGFESDSLLEKKIETQLDKKGIRAYNIKVFYSQYYEISLTITPWKESHSFSNLLASVIGSVIASPVFCVSRKTEGDVCHMKFIEKANYSVEVGFAKISPDGNTKSGDSHLFGHVEKDKYVIALSDGMGHNAEAATQSKITTQLIKKLLSLGFEKETALKIINTFLLYKSQKETYATADICIVNLHSGALEFLKSGAAYTYIKSGSNVSEIKCNSLPCGAVSSLSCDCELIYAKEGDYIIMVTDGISDVLESNCGNTIKSITESFKGNSPQELADEIINAAINKCNNILSDDMTVLVSKISAVM